MLQTPHLWCEHTHRFVGLIGAMVNVSSAKRWKVTQGILNLFVLKAKRTYHCKSCSEAVDDHDDLMNDFVTKKCRRVPL